MKVFCPRCRQKLQMVNHTHFLYYHCNACGTCGSMSKPKELQGLSERIAMKALEFLAKQLLSKAGHF